MRYQNIREAWYLVLCCIVALDFNRTNYAANLQYKGLSDWNGKFVPQKN